LGGGSNVLFVKDFPGLIIKMELKGIEVERENSHFLWVRAYAGERWPDFVDHSVDQGWSGIENLSLIPGTVGAAPIQNIGAYGVEVKETIESVRVLNTDTLEISEMNNQDCEFNYRNSAFKNKLKGKYLVLSVLFKFNKQFIPKIQYQPLKNWFEKQNKEKVGLKEVSEAVKAIRRSKLPDPSVIGNAGSFFKNPTIDQSLAQRIKDEHPDLPVYKVNDKKVKIPAGWLIEQCGWKGKRIGDAGVHPHQALVLVNYGHASGQDILDLAERIQQSVKKKFNLMLEPEVNILSV
jgi:UDP-N-acetylmuramate dehydrogenase